MTAALGRKTRVYLMEVRPVGRLVSDSRIRLSYIETTSFGSSVSTAHLTIAKYSAYEKVASTQLTYTVRMSSGGKDWWPPSSPNLIPLDCSIWDRGQSTRHAATLHPDSIAQPKQ